MAFFKIKFDRKILPYITKITTTTKNSGAFVTTSDKPGPTERLMSVYAGKKKINRQKL